MTGPDDHDPDFVRALAAANPHVGGLLTWGGLLWRLQEAGAVVFPLRTSADLEPMFVAARKAGLGRATERAVRRCIPEAVFPMETFADFLAKLDVVVHLAHHLPDPPKKWP